MLQLFENLEISSDSASWMSSGLRALANCDGTHDAEVALIEEFEKGLGLPPGDPSNFDARTSPLKSEAEVEVFVLSLQLMSLADGKRTDSEQEWVERVCLCLKVSDRRRLELDREARMFLLSSLKGVTAFRHQAEAIGRSLGLSEEDIAGALDAN